MAAQIMRMGGKFNTNLYEIAIDSTDEISMLPTTISHGTGSFSEMKYCIPMGSICIVNDGSKYRLFSDGWHKTGRSVAETDSGSGLTTEDIDEMFEEG